MIHVSLDQRNADYDKFVSNLPCVSISSEEAVCRSKITSLYNVKSIPTVLILGPVPTNSDKSQSQDRPIINANARQQIASTYLNDLKRTNSGGMQPHLDNPCNVRHIANLIPPVAAASANQVNYHASSPSEQRHQQPHSFQM
jgi:hypothetical protein